MKRNTINNQAKYIYVNYLTTCQTLPIKDLCDDITIYVGEIRIDRICFNVNKALIIVNRNNAAMRTK